MKLLKTIYETDIGLKGKILDIKYKTRKAARAVVVNGKNEVAILFVSKHGYHKLPGGGIEAGENMIDALRREIVEEVGANIEVINEIGKIVEYRNENKMLQTSYCYTAKVKGKLSALKLETGEIADGFQLKWIPLNEVIDMFKKDKPDNYEGKFIRIRDLEFLEKA